jgi:hypothetical protein
VTFGPIGGSGRPDRIRLRAVLSGGSAGHTGGAPDHDEPEIRFARTAIEGEEMFRPEVDDARRDEPHVFVEVDVPRAAEPNGRLGAAFILPKMAQPRLEVCGLCMKPKSDHLHLEGQIEADVESPRWGM